MTVRVLEVARRAALVDAMDTFHIRRRSSAGKYVADIVMGYLGDEVYQLVGFIGLRSLKLDTIALPPKWLMVKNKQWWSERFTRKEITIM